MKEIYMKKTIVILLLIAFCVGIYVGLQPDEYSFFTSEDITSDSPFISLEVDEHAVDKSVTATGLTQGKYKAKLKLFGLLPIKSAEISLIKDQKIIPLGVAFGVKLYTDGVITVDITDFIHDGIIRNPAFEVGIREGDVILSYNGVSIDSNEELIEQVQLSEGKPQKVVVRRNNLQFDAEITPLSDDTDGKYRIGLWVRDSTAGIGMLTYYNPNDNTLAGLGHSISDTDTGMVMPVSTGELVKAKINGAIKGESGTPGELIGSFIDNSTIGVLTNNTETGLTAVSTTEEFVDFPAYDIALKDEITPGKAQIISSINGTEREFYDVEIIKINNNLQETKNMVIKITDDRLLGLTGGIVQGMSGSPIIQNGKLIGAVTHVLVDDPTKGYGIFIENMLS